MSDITTWLNNEALEVYRESEDFNDRSLTHDWKNYVPYELVLVWDELTTREKNIIKVLCDDRADDEEWD